MNPQIFREYDLRGVVGRDFDLADVEILGRGYGTYLVRHGGGKAVVGRDCRLSSPEIKEALIKGLTAAGIDIIDLGVCPSPVLYFALFHLEVDGGVMITASHNPPEYNGFKLCLGRETIFGPEIQRFKKVMDDRDFVVGRGACSTYDIITPYSDHIVNNISLARPVKLAVDAGNATGGVVAGPILESTGLPVRTSFF